MSQQRERGFLPAFRPTECLHNLVKSAPNLDNKSRSSTTSASTDNILLGNSVTASCDSVTSASSINSHHYTNTNYHSIYYERDLTRKEGIIENRKISTISIRSQNHSTESIELDNSDESEQTASVGCFSFVSAGSSSDVKKIKGRYQKLSKSNSSEIDNQQLLLPKSDQRKNIAKPSSSNSRKNNNDVKKKIQFQEFSAPKAKFKFDLKFYKSIEQSLDAIGDQELSEQDIIYITSKPSKNKLAMRLQKSLDAIDSIEIIGADEPSERIYSKSIDDLSFDDGYELHRGGSQFTRKCFLKNGSKKKGCETQRANDDTDSSSQESIHRKNSWPSHQY